MRLEEIKNRKAQKAFIEVPRILYSDDDTWVCPFNKEIDSIFDPKRTSILNMAKPPAGCSMMILGN